jgi:hypothetical protein
VGKKPRPPICEITWGSAPETLHFPFRGVVTGLTEKFTLFDGDGTPLRAELGVTFTEFEPPKNDQKETDPEFTTRVVNSGDTLSSIAAEMYSDPALWRLIAEENSVEDPRSIQIGRMLRIPGIG